MHGKDEAHEPVLVVSDGTGETAQKVVKAALRQFSDHHVPMLTYGQTKQVGQLETIFRAALRQGALVVTTLVQDDTRRDAERLARELGVRHVDLLGPLLHELESFLDRTGAGVPGLLHRADSSYYRRIEAIEFTVRADDGKDPRILHAADVVLVGVSRTGKTPLSTFLAHKGLKVSNQPLVLDQPVPPQLFEIDPRRVFALTIEPAALQEIRRARLREMRMTDTVNYDDMSYILADLEYAAQTVAAGGWPVIDVTNKAIEETAAEILRMLDEHGLLPRWDEGDVG